ncbi:copper resistance CopC family protein [Arthrobacter sp. Z4-13]
MRSIRRHLLSFVLGSFVFAAAVLGLAGPAAAHDAAESSTPAQGASVAAPPEQVSVTFNNNPLGIGSSFSVMDASGAEWADGPVDIVDNVASQKLKAGGPAGQYTVTWRVVSADSHPIEGTFTFTASSAAEGAAPAAGPTAAATVPGMGTAEPGVTAAPETVGSGEPFQWSIVIFAAAAVGLLAALAIIARRRLAAGGDDES